VTIVLAAFGLMVLIFELVRKRRLREEYSWLWLLTGVSVLALAVVPQQALVAMANVFGSENPPAAIFFFVFVFVALPRLQFSLGFCFVALLCLQFSVRLSRTTEHVKTLAQKIALLEADLEAKERSRP